MTSQAAAVSKKYGGKPEEHFATYLTRQHVEDSDIVIVMSRRHRRSVVEIVPQASSKTFTLLELERLLRSLHDAPAPLYRVSSAGPKNILSRIVAAAASQRGYVRPDEPLDDDIADPYRRSQAIYDRVGAAIDSAVNSIARSVETLATQNKTST
jgi:protein-tyrosine phosphatase